MALRGRASDRAGGITPPHKKSGVSRAGLTRVGPGQERDSRARIWNRGDIVTREELRAAIKADLLDQLDRNGKVGHQYKDMVEDYLTMWDAKNGLAEDLDKNGVVRTRVYSNGTSTPENSKSVEQFIKVNARMSALLSELGADEPAFSEDDEM